VTDRAVLVPSEISFRPELHAPTNKTAGWSVTLHYADGGPGAACMLRVTEKGSALSVGEGGAASREGAREHAVFEPTQIPSMRADICCEHADAPCRCLLALLQGVMRSATA
jgi:hypothetical protein